MTGDIIIYENMRLTTLQGTYSDNYGFYMKEVKDKEHDLKKFKLNHSQIDKVKCYLLDHKITERIVQLSLLKGKVYIQGIY